MSLDGRSCVHVEAHADAGDRALRSHSALSGRTQAACYCKATGSGCIMPSGQTKASVHGAPWRP